MSTVYFERYCFRQIKDKTRWQSVLHCGFSSVDGGEGLDVMEAADAVIDLKLPFSVEALPIFSLPLRIGMLGTRDAFRVHSASPLL